MTQHDALVCFPMRSEWEALHPREESPYPAPVVTSREESAFPMPAPVIKLAEFAREQGWEVRTQYAQGYPPHGSTGRPGVLKDSIAVIIGGHPIRPFRAAYACYERTAPNGAWSWDGILIQGSDLTPYAGCGVTELKAFLMMSAVTDGPALESWVSGLREIAANGEQLQKRRDAMRKEIRAMALSDRAEAERQGQIPAGTVLREIVEHAAAIYSADEVKKLLAMVSRKAEKETSR